MKLFYGMESLGNMPRGSVLALGNFDGVHLGHQSILKECVALARARGSIPAVMTFEPHPREYFSREHSPLRIHALREKIKAIEACGVEHSVILRFNAALAHMSAEDFTRHILHDRLGVTHVVTGFNFAFGHQRQGDSAFLTRMAQELGFGYTAHARVSMQDGQTISSSAIRARLAEGKVEEATRMLGRPYSIGGHVTHGHKRGRELGWPTINLPMKKRFKPRFGVYACTVAIEGEKTRYNAVANIGINPTFSGEVPLLEAHCFGLAHDVYGRRVEIYPLTFLRDEATFDSAEALKHQIAQDAAQARRILNA